MHYKFITSLVCTYILKILFHRNCKDVGGGGARSIPPQKFPIQFLTDDWYAFPLSLKNLPETLLSTFKQIGLRFWGIGAHRFQNFPGGAFPQESHLAPCNLKVDLQSVFYTHQEIEKSPPPPSEKFSSTTPPLPWIRH